MTGLLYVNTAALNRLKIGQYCFDKSCPRAFTQAGLNTPDRRERAYRTYSNEPLQIGWLGVVVCQDHSVPSSNASVDIPSASAAG